MNALLGTHNVVPLDQVVNAPDEGMDVSEHGQNLPGQPEQASLPAETAADAPAPENTEVAPAPEKAEIASDVATDEITPRNSA